MDQMWLIVMGIVTILILIGIIWFCWKKTTMSGSVGGNKDAANAVSSSGGNTTTKQ